MARDCSEVEGRMSASQRRKGRAWEQKVARLFREALPGIEVRRLGGLQASKNESGNAPDVAAGPFWIECKVGARTNPRAALAQAVEGAAGLGPIPIAVTKDDNQDPIITMKLADALDIFNRWWRLPE